jgi:hypothetical protein
VEEETSGLRDPWCEKGWRWKGPARTVVGVALVFLVLVVLVCLVCRAGLVSLGGAERVPCLYLCSSTSVLFSTRWARVEMRARVET